MKSYTDLEQSKKLIELGVDVNTADMIHNILGESYVRHDTPIDKYHTPAWSLAALLGYIKDKCGYFELVYLNSTIDGRANILKNIYRLSTDIYDIYQKEAIDACYEMILKLHEQKLL